MYFADIVIRIDEELDEDFRRTLASELSREEGIYRADIHEERRHLLLVDFDPDRVQPACILQSLRDRGLHAETLVR